jgi:hypothetical protein
MHTGSIAAAGIFVLSAIGLSACDGGDPASTGSTSPPAVQGEEAPNQAMPTQTEDQNAPASESTGSGG